MAAPTRAPSPSADAPAPHLRATWLAMLMWSAASLTASFVLAVEAVTLAARPTACCRATSMPS